jgi:hypothetical protein
MKTAFGRRPSTFGSRESAIGSRPSPVGSRESAVGSGPAGVPMAPADRVAVGTHLAVRHAIAGSSLVVLLALLAGCTTVGPDYARPAVTTPETHRGATAPANVPGIGEQPWEAVFQDEALRPLSRKR